MAIAYKWKIDNNTTAYITDEKGGSPFVYCNLSGNTRQTSSESVRSACVGMPSDKAIEIATNNFDEDSYSANFAALRSLLEHYYGYELLEGDNYNTGVYYWPENDYNKTALDVQPDFKVVGAEEPPKLSAELYGTDSTKKIKLDIELPAGYDGFTCYLSPDNLSFVREDIINGIGTLSASTEVMLFRGTEKLEPYSLEVEQSYEDDEITISGSTITIKPHVTVTPPNSNRAVYDLRGVSFDETNTTTIDAPQTSTTTVGPVDTTTTTRPRKKIELSDRKIWVTVTYRWREYGSNEFMYFNTKLLLRYNILTYDLIEASKNGDLNTDNYDTKDGFEKWVSNRDKTMKTHYSIQAGRFEAKAINTEREASSQIVATADEIGAHLIDEINETSADVWITANGLKRKFENVREAKTNKIEQGAYGRETEITDGLRGIRATFTDNAAQKVQTYQDEVNRGTAQVTESLGGIVQVMSGYTSGLTSLYALLNSGVETFVKDDISGYASAFVFDAGKMLMVVSSVTGSYNGIKATATEIDTVAESADAAARIIQEADSICMSAEGTIANMYGDLERKKSEIVQRSGVINISSNEIKLEGETTFNSGFTILEDGSAIIDNGYLHGYSQCLVKDITNERIFVNCDTNITYPYMNNGDLSAITVSGFEVGEFVNLTGGTTGVTDYFGDRVYEIPMCLGLAKYGEVDDNKQTPLYLDEFHAIYASENTKYSIYTINKKTPTSLLLDAKKLRTGTDDRVQIFLPIDPEYVGTTIKIIVNNVGAENNIFPEITVGYTNNYGIYWPQVKTEKELVWDGAGYERENKVTPFGILYSVDGNGHELLQLGPIVDENETPHNTLKIGSASAFTGSVELTAVPSTTLFYGRKDPFLPNGLPSRLPLVSGGNISFSGLTENNNKVDNMVCSYTVSSDKLEGISLAKWIVNKIDVIKGDFEYELRKRPN